jgi:hypothetical protein
MYPEGDSLVEYSQATARRAKCGGLAAEIDDAE